MITFVAFLLVFFPVILIASLFGRIAGGNTLYFICTVWSHIWMFIIGMRHKNIVVSPINKHASYVYVANHISYMDIPVIFRAVNGGHFRILGKIELSKVPIFGYLYRNAVVMVDRGSPEKRARSVKILKSILKREISIFIYPEGTFNETPEPLKSFYDGAFKLAIEMQTPIKPIVFLDTVDRLHYKSILSFTPGISRAVILPEISVEGRSMKDVAALKEETYHAMEACLKAYKV